MEQRYLVDILSETHQKALNNNLSYKEGIILNNISYMEEHYGECNMDKLPSFLHMTPEDVYDSVQSLLKKDLINVDGKLLTIKEYTLDELTDDPVIAAMMAAFIKQTNLKVGFDPFEKYREK